MAGPVSERLHGSDSGSGSRRGAGGPSLRRWTAAVAFAAAGSAVAVRVFRAWTAAGPADWQTGAVGVGCLAGPSALALGAFVLAADRPGNPRRWATLAAASVAVPVASAAVDATLALRLGRPDPVDALLAAALNAPLLFWAVRFAPAMWPARCPSCGARALLRVRLDPDDAPDDDLRECAECRSLFRRPRGRRSPWRPFDPGGRPGR